MLNFALQLIIAHLIGDFVLQSSKWVDDKNKRKLQSIYLYLHIAIHFLLLLLFTQFQSKYFLAIGLIALSHLIIDVVKIYIESKNSNKKWFFVDQFMHFLVIAGVVKYYFNYKIMVSVLSQTKTLLLVTAIIVLTFVAAVVIKIILEKWDFKNKDSKKDSNNAGTLFGILERLFVFVFIYINFWEGIGFLIAAKSIFRFGDLTASKDIKLTEYILVGTLLSFGIAIATSLFYNYLYTKI